jgi:DNA-binding HxlR family transcriptional regulator
MKNQTNNKMKAETAHASESCGVSEPEIEDFRRALKTIFGRWKIEIMWRLLSGPLRFGELRRALPGITQHMLTAQLRALEVDGLITRTTYAEVPPRVDYALTPSATALRPVFLTLLEWARTTRP